MRTTLPPDALGRSVRALRRFGAWAVLLVCGLAQAAYPDRPITLVVPFAAGGPADAMGRTLARAMSVRLGQEVIVENKPGAGGALGIAAVARAPADGYTIGMAGTGAMVYAPFIVLRPLFDPLTALTHLSPMVRTPNVLVVRADSPYRTVADLVARAHREPGALNIASAGVGSSTHVVGALFQREAGIRMSHVPYKGAAPALQDLLGGRVELFFAETPAVAQLIRGGKLRALVVTDGKRLAALPEVPTAIEAGLPALLAEGAYGLVAPPELPPDIARRLLDAATDALRSPEVVDKFAGQGGIAQPGTPQSYRAQLKAEQERWGPIIKAAGIQPE
jgi:tripartite-type tricarboxylate transporter receptor subunit TctC